MKIWIDRRRCQNSSPDCRSCFDDGLRQRPCIVACRDDGSDTLTIFLEAQNHEELLINPPALLKLGARGAWRSCAEMGA
jgi:hypothetical protein